MSVPERNIQIELYRILKNLIDKKFVYNDIEFLGVSFEPTINGRPDLVIEAVDKGKKIALLVIDKTLANFRLSPFGIGFLGF